MLGIIHGMLGAVISGLGRQRGRGTGKPRQAGKQRVFVHSRVSRLAVCSICKTGQTKLHTGLALALLCSIPTTPAGTYRCLGGPSGLGKLKVYALDILS